MLFTGVLLFQPPPPYRYFSLCCLCSCPNLNVSRRTGSSIPNFNFVISVLAKKKMNKTKRKAEPMPCKRVMLSKHRTTLRAFLATNIVRVACAVAEARNPPHMASRAAHRIPTPGDARRRPPQPRDVGALHRDLRRAHLRGALR